MYLKNYNCICFISFLGQLIPDTDYSKWKKLSMMFLLNLSDMSLILESPTLGKDCQCSLYPTLHYLVHLNEVTPRPQKEKNPVYVTSPYTTSP